MKLQEQNNLQGRLTIRKYKAPFLWLGKLRPVLYNIAPFLFGRELISETRGKNKIVNSSGHGRNLVIRQLAGDTTYGMEIDEGRIGDDNTTPVDANTDLNNAVLSSITVETATFSGDEATFSFFILDGNLADGTYEEFGLFIGGQMFSHALFASSYVKGAGEDTRVDYTVTLSSS